MTWIDPEEFKYLSQWKYVELAHWVPNLERVIRVQDNKVPVMIEWTEVAEFLNRHDNTGCYTSVWLYDNRDIDRAKRLGSLYFDLDSDEAEAAQQDTIKLVNYLREFIPEDGIRVYFSGAKGFHVECEAVVCGITPSNNLPGLFRYIAGELRDLLGLTTIDFAVYDQRRMWRVPNSINQKTGLYKIPLKGEALFLPLDEIKELARNPIEEVIEGLKFHAKSNEWYREWGYKQDAGKTISLDERIARFNKHGTSVITSGYDEEQVFDPESLLKNCPAILRLWEKAEKEHHLLHEERLFLCSILTYTDQAQDYLIQILQNCDDFNIEKTMSHIDDWKRRRENGTGGHPYSCRKANEVGAGCGNCALEPIAKKEKIGNTWVLTGEYGEPSPYRFGYHPHKDFVSKYPIIIKEDEIKHI